MTQIAPEGVSDVLGARVARHLACAHTAGELIGGDRPDGLFARKAHEPDLLMEPGLEGRLTLERGRWRGKKVDRLHSLCEHED